MRWSREGLMEPTSIFDAATLYKAIMPVCSCGHATRFEARGLWWHFERRGWDDRLAAVPRRFWCRICASRHRRKVRPVRIDAPNGAPGDFELPLPDERILKRATSRVR